MLPPLTEIQKISYFHSLLRGNALQAYCNLDDAKEDILEEVITEFKRRFGDFQPSAKARCEWDSLHFDPIKQKLHEFLDTIKKLPVKRSVQRRRNSSIKPYTQKCRTMSKRYLIALTSKTSHILTLSYISKERCASVAWALLMKPL